MAVALKEVPCYTIQACDCIEGLDNLEGGEIDIIVTSPPYNLGINYDGSYDDNMPREDYLRWMTDVAYAMFQALNDNGSLFLNLGSKPTDPCVPFEVLSIMLRMFKLQNTFHWIKSISIETEQEVVSHGHYKPINSPRFVNDCHEYIFHLTKTGKVPLDRLAIGVPYADDSNATRWQTGSDTRCRGNVWFIPYKTIQSREDERPHPATFPVKLPEQCMRLHGLDRITTACDPFVGLGSSAKAAQNLNIARFYGFDICEDYVRRTQEMIGDVR